MNKNSRRNKGLMARALEQSENTQATLPNHSDGFSNAITVSKKNAPSSGHISSAFLRVSAAPTISKTLHSDNKNDESAHFSFKEDHVQNLNSNSLTVSSTVKCSSPTSPLSESLRKKRMNKQVSSDALLPIQENEQVKEENLASTQHLRSGFFRTIKKHYSPSSLDGIGLGNGSFDSGKGESIESPVESTVNSPLAYISDHKGQNEQSEEDVTFMSSMARKRLKEFRQFDPKKVDVATGLQWIRLELHEMREQDKSLFLQLIKLHSTIKEIRNEMKFMEDSYDSCFESFDGLASYWWPRCNGPSVLPDFSSSDGAHLLTRRQSQPLLKRGFSFNSRASRMPNLSNLSRMGTGSLFSFSSSMSSAPSETTL